MPTTQSLLIGQLSNIHRIVRIHLKIDFISFNYFVYYGSIRVVRRRAGVWNISAAPCHLPAKKKVSPEQTVLKPKNGFYDRETTLTTVIQTSAALKYGKSREESIEEETREGGDGLELLTSRPEEDTTNHVSKVLL